MRPTVSILYAVLLDVNLPAAFVNICLSPDITAWKTFNRHAGSFLLPSPYFFFTPIVYINFALMPVTGASQPHANKAHRVTVQRLNTTSRYAHQLAHLHAH